MVEKKSFLQKNQKGFAPIIILVISAIVVFFSIKPIQTIIEQKIGIVPKPSPLITAQVSPAGNTPINALSDADQQKKLEKYLTVEAALLGVSDNISLFFKDLDHGKEFSIEPSKSWIPASTIKAYVVLEAFRQRDLGLINFDSQVTITADNVVPTELETDEFPRLREGMTATIRQLVEAMIIQSDNIAYNTLLDILDRKNINLALKHIGLTETVVGEKLNLDDNQFQTDLQAAGRQPNTTTVKDLTTFFDLLYNHKIADSNEILNIFKRQKINNMIPALLPVSTKVAHKTGEWASIYHDGGVIFKPSDPFILTVFTNTGDPNIVAKLARVAYFQTADSVGQAVSLNNQQTNRLFASTYEKIVLSDESDSNVLAESTNNEKFPAVTAADLGINQQDLSVTPQEASNLPAAFLTPGGLLYNLKTFIQDEQLKFAIGDSEKAKKHIAISKDQLSEVKTLLQKGDIGGVQSLLNESEKNLAKATELSKNSPDKDLLLIQIKQVNDLHFAVLNERAQKIPNQDKEKFIDTVYNFYQKSKAEVTSVVNTSIIANVTQQKPAIGTVTEVKDNTATLQFDDGTKKEVILNDGAKVRAFHQDTYQSPSSITTGDKIAVIGITNAQAKIIPEFILKDVPKELPNKHNGTIIEISPDQNTLRILNKKGQQEVIKVLSNTVIQSKDTNVSLSGIKAGSQITVFGVVTNTNLPQITNSPQSLVAPSPLPSASLPKSSSAPPSFVPSSSTKPLINPSQTNSPLPSVFPTSTPKIPQASALPAQKSSINKKPIIELKATSITVTSNSSGKNEVTTNKKSNNKPNSVPLPPAQSNKSKSAPAPAPTKKP